MTISGAPIEARRIRIAAIAWVVVVLAGFGVMSVMWVLGDWPEDLPGWGDYRAAVVGDGVFVPTMTAIAWLANSLLARSPRDRLALIAGGAIGAASGAVVQCVWLADSSPHLNWAMLKVHHFTFPGWYHAIFLTAMTAVLGALSLRLAVRARAARRVPFSRTISTCAMGFALLQTVDATYPAGYLEQPEQSPGGIISAAMTVAAVALALAILTPRHHRTHRNQHLAGIAIGAAAAVVISLVCFPWPQSTGPGMLLAVLLVAGCAGVDVRDLAREPEVGPQQVVRTGPGRTRPGQATLDPTGPDTFNAEYVRSVVSRSAP